METWEYMKTVGCILPPKQVDQALKKILLTKIPIPMKTKTIILSLPSPKFQILPTTRIAAIRLPMLLIASKQTIHALSQDTLATTGANVIKMPPTTGQTHHSVIST
jgi:hypothetical protein